MKKTVAEKLAENVYALSFDAIPKLVQEQCQDLLLDVAGLCVAALMS